MDTTHLYSGQLQRYTYRKLRIVDYTLDDADLDTRCPLNNGRHSTKPQYSVGQLDALPLEIVAEILLALDLPTLTTFQRVNRRAMSLIDSLHPYGIVLKHCPNVLCAIISIDANSFDCRTLYKTLSTNKCKTCERFGGYLYLITCKRVCYFCFTSDPDYLPVAVKHAAKHTGLSRRELKHLPRVFSLPGQYTAGGKLSKRRIMLFDRQVVLKRASKTSIQAFDGKMQQQDRTTREPRRYMSIVSAPCFGSSGQSADWGFHCTAWLQRQYGACDAFREQIYKRRHS